MRIIEDKNPEPNSDGLDNETNGWDNLPYPVIHAIAKLKFTSLIHNFCYFLLICKSTKAL